MFLRIKDQKCLLRAIFFLLSQLSSNPNKNAHADSVQCLGAEKAVCSEFTKAPLRHGTLGSQPFSICLRVLRKWASVLGAQTPQETQVWNFLSSISETNVLSLQYSSAKLRILYKSPFIIINPCSLSGGTRNVLSFPASNRTACLYIGL